jgi:hypothetical protein
MRRPACGAKTWEGSLSSTRGSRQRARLARTRAQLYYGLQCVAHSYRCCSRSPPPRRRWRNVPQRFPRRAPRSRARCRCSRPTTGGTPTCRRRRSTRTRRHSSRSSAAIDACIPTSAARSLRAVSQPTAFLVSGGSSISRAATAVPTRGRPPMPRASPSCPASCATTKRLIPRSPTSATHFA